MIVDIAKGGFDPGYVTDTGGDDILFHAYFPTANAAFRRSALEKVGGFDERCTTGEDLELCFRLARAGYELFFEPQAKVAHAHRDTLGGLMRQWYGYGAHHPYLIKKHGTRSLSLYRFGDVGRGRQALRALRVPFPVPAVVFVTWFLCGHLALLAAALTPWALVVAALCLLRYATMSFVWRRPLRSVAFAAIRYATDVAFFCGAFTGSVRYGALYVPAARERTS